MLVDQMLAALATMRQHLMPIDAGYSADQVRSRLDTISIMRDYVLRNDGQAFTHYVQGKLRGDTGDMMCDLIESMYTALGLDSSATMWDEFAEEFIAQND